jgi:hypothetical protein
LAFIGYSLSHCFTRDQLDAADAFAPQRRSLCRLADGFRRRSVEDVQAQVLVRENQRAPMSCVEAGRQLRGEAGEAGRSGVGQI